MTERIRASWRRLVNFHEDEEGMEAIQVVAIVAIAAIVLVFVKNVAWPKIEKFFNRETQKLVGE